MQLNTNLTKLRELNGDFDRYLLLFYLVTGDFQEVEAGKILDPEKFERLFPGICRKSPAELLRALKYSRHIDLTAGWIFKVLKPEGFQVNDLQAPKSDPQKVPNKTKLLKGCEALAHFNSAEFVEAWRDYETVMTKKKKPRTANTTKLGAAELLRLSGGNEHLATLIVQQSTNGGWPGFFPLKPTGKTGTTKHASQYYE